MTPERWRQVEEILQATLDRQPTERAALLTEACAGDEELRCEVASLVNAHEAAGDFIEQPALVHDALVLAQDHFALTVGREVGPYTIIRHLGAGGMSDVYLARDTRLGRSVALKILPAYFVSDAVRVGRFQQEARAASALNHPGILTIHEVGEWNGVNLIVTEYIDGQTLRELFTNQRLPIEQVLDIAIQTASALAAAHAAGIIHRDIKPENIMLRSDGIVKILDFGIAKLTEPPAPKTSGGAPTIVPVQTETGVVMGTVGYMSPEQARGLPVDQRTDIWSFGVVLYEMIAKRAPFAGATRMDTLVAILEREPPPLIQFVKAAPAEMQLIISKALRKERLERYQTITQMLEDLKTIKPLLSSPGAATDHTAAISSDNIMQPASFIARDTARRARRLNLVAVLLAGLLIVTMGLFLYRRAVARRQAETARRSVVATTPKKLYTSMTEAEQLEFIDEQEQRISTMMGDRPVKLKENALRAIKSSLDHYAARSSSMSNVPGGEDLRLIYSRAASYAPLIARSFAARKVPVIVGLYLPMIESEYRTCFESRIGAKGIFQFLPTTAKQYGVAHSEMCDAEKMTPAAAHYIADRMAELGDDSASGTLVLLSYNCGPEWVRDTLRQLRNTENYERNFWTILANQDKLDNTLSNEAASYVPRFFAAAIIGENPQSFGLQIPALSTLSSTS